VTAGPRRELGGTRVLPQVTRVRSVG
jgi:hypothetical protein